MASRAGSAWAMKSIAARYCCFSTSASTNSLGLIPGLSNRSAALSKYNRAQISEAVAAVKLRNIVLFTAAARESIFIHQAMAVQARPGVAAGAAPPADRD